jgi:hypothetical protein
MKSKPDPLYTAENVPDAQNMTTVPDSLNTAENGSGRAKDENWTRHLRYR